MNTIKVVVLDFDNFILLDPKTRTGSEEIKNETFYSIFPEYEREEIEPVLTKAKQVFSGGKGDNLDIIKFVLRHFRIPRKDIESLTEIKSKLFMFFVGTRVIRINISDRDRKSLVDLQMQVPLYINTGSRPQYVKEQLDRLKISHLFKGVYSRPATKAKNLQAIIKKEQILPEELLFGDDLPGGWQAAQEVGCRFIGMHTANVTEWHNGNQPFPIIYSLSEIVNMI